MNNEKQLKDYLNLYLGCRFWDYGSEEGHEIATITGVYNNNNVCMVCDEHGNTDIKPEEIKLILRRLESMTMSDVGDWAIESGTEDGFQAYTKSSHDSMIKDIQEKGIDAFGGTDDSMSNHVKFVFFLLSKKFDLFGLIDADLAIDAATLTQKEDKS